MIKACIFDLDGTLTDTLESLAYSVQLTLEEMGLQKITKEQCKSFVGNGARRLMELSLQAAGADPCERLEEGMRIYGRIFDANCTYHVTPYEGIVSTLKTVSYTHLVTPLSFFVARFIAKKTFSMFQHYLLYTSRCV